MSNISLPSPFFVLFQVLNFYYIAKIRNRFSRRNGEDHRSLSQPKIIINQLSRCIKYSVWNSARKTWVQIVWLNDWIKYYFNQSLELNWKILEFMIELYLKILLKIRIIEIIFNSLQIYHTAMQLFTWQS